jgi:CHAT domain-containing protein
MIVSPRRRRVGWRIAAVAVLCLTAGFVLLVVSRTKSDRLLRIAASTSSHRIEGRLAGFAHASPSSLAAATGEFAAGLFTSRTRSREHTSAIESLVYASDGTRAVTQFESLVAHEPTNADAWNDLAVARLQDGMLADDARSIARSLAAADHALRLNRAHAEAMFNRSLALDALGLHFAATVAWRRYLSVDADSPWAVDATKRLAASDVPTRDAAWKRAEVELGKALDRGDEREVESIVARFPQQARIATEMIHMPAWADAYLAGNTQASEQLLKRVRLIAAALKKHRGDSLLDAAAANPSAALARGFVAYGKGRAANVARKVAESLGHFVEAERLFESARNPMALSAAYFRANALVDLGRREESEVIADALEPRVDAAFQSLRAHLFWLRARLTNDAGRHYDSLLVTRNAREIFERLGELDYVDRLRTAEAAMLARLGRDREAWQCRRLALAGAAASGKWNLVEVAIEAIAREEVDGPDREIARSLFDVQVSAPSVLPLMRFNGLLWSAYLDARETGTRPDMTAARIAAARIPDAAQRDDSLDELRLAEALAMRETSPSGADALLSEVIDYRTRRGLLTYLPAIHLQRARLRRTLLESDVAAEQDLRRAIELIESRSVRMLNDTLRDAFLGSSDAAYEELGDLLLSRGDWLGAFETSERARARELDARSVKPPAVPQGVVVAHYTSYPTRTLLVLLEHGRLTHHVIDVPRAEIVQLRDRLAAAPETDPSARRLYDLLIAPLQNVLAPDGVLLLAPDQTTYGIPFAVLRDAKGRSLIAQTAIALGPSAAAIPTEEPKWLPSRSTATIVADPAFSPTLFQKLERLPAAREDAEVVGRMFNHATLLTGVDATRSALMAAVPECDVLHVAAHAISSARDASLSLVALAPSAGDSGILYLDDVATLRFRRRPLVVLAGCQTGSFGGGRGSIRSLAHAFLAAGSGAVLSTLWNVDDESASELTAEVYRRLADGMSLPMALRAAQLSSPRGPHEWAAFQVHLGTVSKRQ